MRSHDPDPPGEPVYRGEERRRSETPDQIEPVVLTRKYADEIDGVNLAGCDVGDRLPVSRREARLLIAEGWAAPAPLEERRQPDGEDFDRS